MTKSEDICDILQISVFCNAEDGEYLMVIEKVIERV